MFKYSYFVAAIYLKHLDLCLQWSGFNPRKNCEGFLVENMTFEEVLTATYSCETGLKNLYVFTPPIFRSGFT
jgi:hypothetical protein